MEMNPHTRIHDKRFNPRPFLSSGKRRPADPTKDLAMIGGQRWEDSLFVF
jgi:hypothetical protein